MARRMIPGWMVLAIGMILAACSVSNPLLPLPVGILVHFLPIGIVSATMLLRCKKSDLMADISAAIVGCLWGSALGIALSAGFLKLITSRSAHPYDEMAYGVLVVLALLAIAGIWLVDFIRKENGYSFRRFLLEGCIAACLVLPNMIPAMQVMAFFEGILSKLV